MNYEKQFHFRVPHRQERGAAAPTSTQCQRLCKGLLGPQVSPEEVRSHYVQLKIRSFEQNGNWQSEGFERHKEKFAQRAV